MSDSALMCTHTYPFALIPGPTWLFAACFLLYCNMREQNLSMVLSPRTLLVGGWGQPGPLIRARRVRRQLLAFKLATILELCFYANTVAIILKIIPA